MPAIDTVINDLFTRQCRGIGPTHILGAKGSKDDRDLSLFYRVQNCYRPITASIGAGPNFLLEMTDSPTWGNGHFLFFEDGKSTVATIDRRYRIVVGGNYSGCLYSVYKVGDGTFKCVHTARPSGANSDTYVAGIRGYAADQRWTLIHEIPTSGLVGTNGCKTVFFATRVDFTVVPSPIVRTVRLQQDVTGITVGQHVWNDPS